MAADWALSVSELNEYVRKQLAADPMLRAVRVRGEISGFKRPASGHLYFTLKDDQARVACVMFRQSAMGLGFSPRDGMRVTVTGSVSLYVQSGSYQVYCETMREEGAGELYLRFEALKKKLADEGLFDASRKRPLPACPRVVGVVTSRTGAVLRDIVRVARRRDPNVAIRLAPCAVQGADAAKEIVSAIALLNADARAQVLLVGRGGGSIEDLWPFNEESVARAIAASAIPVVSCVGHETDFTIADFAADLRAPTPSAAAELAVADANALLRRLDECDERSRRALVARAGLCRARLERLAASGCLSMADTTLLAPQRGRLNLLAHRCDATFSELRRAARARLPERERLYLALEGALKLRRSRLAEPNRLLDAAERAQRAARERYAALRARLDAAAERQRGMAASRLALCERALVGLNPTSVLARGYAVVKRKGGIAERAAELRVGERVELMLRDGTAKADVAEIFAEAGE